jgi:hypothetical protein
MLWLLSLSDVETMTDDQDLPRFDFDASPRAEQCQRCSAAAAGGADLRFVIVRGRDRYFGRTLCDVCAEEMLEALLGAA